MSTLTKEQLYKRCDEWIRWYNYNKPNQNTPIEGQLAFNQKALFGSFELIARLVEVAMEGGLDQQPQIILPTGVVLHEDIHVK